VTGRAERAKDLVGRDVEEPERVAALAAERLPVSERFAEQRVGPDDVRLDERSRRVDGPIDVRLGREMQHRARLVFVEESSHCVVIADIDPLEDVGRGARHWLERVEVAGVGQLVDVDHTRVAAPDEHANHGGTDETGAAGDEECHEVQI
jgi:hypothetical protein